MPRSLHFHRKMDLNTPDGKTHHFPPGLHEDVADEIADHWYTQHHAVEVDEKGKPVKKPPPPPPADRAERVTIFHSPARSGPAPKPAEAGAEGEGGEEGQEGGEGGEGEPGGETKTVAKPTPGKPAKSILGGKRK